MAGDRLGGGGAPGREPRHRVQGAGAEARRPGDAGQREPAGMVHLRSGDHGGGAGDGADLHHQHRARPPAHPGEQRRLRGDRLDAQARQGTDARRAQVQPGPACHRHRGDALSRHGRASRLACADRRAPGYARRYRRAVRPRRSGVHHLHVRHGRRAARGDAAPRRDPAQRGRHRSGHRGGFRLEGRGVPVVPPAQPRL